MLRDDYRGWLESLSKEEKKAIYKYSKNSFSNKPDKFYLKINLALRGEYE